MATEEFESRLDDETSVASLVTNIEDYTSAWWDMRTAAQMMFGRRRLGEQPEWGFERRAILDGAVMAYSRCIESGRRRTDIRALVAALDTPMAETARVIDQWRDHHVAHRVNRAWEAVNVTMLWETERKRADYPKQSLHSDQAVIARVRATVRGPRPSSVEPDLGGISPPAPAAGIRPARPRAARRDEGVRHAQRPRDADHRPIRRHS